MTEPEWTEQKWTEREWTELLDLSLDGALPEAWQARVDAYVCAHPEAARDAESLRRTLETLASAPMARPDAWFVERALQGVLHEHRADISADIAQER